MASQRTHPTLASPTQARNVDLLDTKDWTVKDWEAARLLAEQLTLRNAAKRAAAGGNQQYSIPSQPSTASASAGAGIANKSVAANQEGRGSASAAGYRTGNDVYDTSDSSEDSPATPEWDWRLE